jgi:hypothetical protein
VGDSLGVEAADDAQIVGDPGYRRKEFRHPQTTRSPLGKLPQRLHNPLRRALPRLGEAAEIGKRHLFAVVDGQSWLGIEAVDLAHATGHEEEDHPLGTEGKVRAGHGGGRTGMEAGKGQRSESAPGTHKRGPPRQDDR